MREQQMSLDVKKKKTTTTTNNKHIFKIPNNNRYSLKQQTKASPPGSFLVCVLVSCVIEVGGVHVIIAAFVIAWLQ
jgi:hypothetical protein